MNVILHFGPYYRNRNTMKRMHEITMRGTMETITNHDRNLKVLVDGFGNVFFSNLVIWEEVFVHFRPILGEIFILRVIL